MANNKTLYIVIGILVLVIIGGTLFFIGDRGGRKEAEITQQTNEKVFDRVVNSDQTSAGQFQNKLVTDDFEMNIPSGWVQAPPAMGASAMAVNAKESLNDPAAQKINFKSYFAVSYDVLQEKNLNEYSEIIKNGLKQTIQGVVFSNEQDVVVNGRPARALEAEMSQQGANFKILMVSVKGEGDDVWTLSFNTTKSAWDSYAQTFSNIVNSFNLKKQF